MVSKARAAVTEKCRMPVAGTEGHGTISDVLLFHPISGPGSPSGAEVRAFWMALSTTVRPGLSQANGYTVMLV